jgi:hypothetical protein
VLKIRPVGEWRSVYLIYLLFVWGWYIFVLGWLGLAIGWIPAIPMAFALSAKNKIVFMVLDAIVLNILSSLVLLIIFGLPVALRATLME